MKRRHLLLGGLAAAGATAAGLRPSPEGAPHSAYFARLQKELQEHGPMKPCLVVDLDRLDRNIDRVVASVGRQPGRHLRVVEKSLPSAGLLEYVCQRSGSRRLMSFHQPFLNLDARRWPQADILLGKPLPARSAARFYAQHRGPFQPQQQLQWLIDSPQRLQQYLQLAQSLGQTMRINIEIDVGLHRGGVADDASLIAMLDLITAHPRHLHFAGFMGYDPHVVALPSVVATREELFADAMGRYQHCCDLLRERHPSWWQPDQLTLNAAGSPTYRLHEAESLSNDIAVGTGLLKPSHYDLDTLAEHEPALFIATPVLKASGSAQLPALPKVSQAMAWWNPNFRSTYFIYGGQWGADFVSPTGLRHNPLYGRSANQEMVNASTASALGVDDLIFLRPHITEGTLLQFGDLLALRDGRIVEQWPVFTEGQAEAAALS